MMIIYLNSWKSSSQASNHPLYTVLLDYPSKEEVASSFKMNPIWFRRDDNTIK